MLKQKSLTKAGERTTSAEDCWRVSVGVSVQQYSVQCKGYILIGVTTVEASETRGTTALVYWLINSSLYTGSVHVLCSVVEYTPTGLTVSRGVDSSPQSILSESQLIQYHFWNKESLLLLSVYLRSSLWGLSERQLYSNRAARETVESYLNQIWIWICQLFKIFLTHSLPLYYYTEFIHSYP